MASEGGADQIRKGNVMKFKCGVLAAGVLLAITAHASAHLEGVYAEYLTFEGVPGWQDNYVTMDLFVIFSEPTDELISVESPLMTTIGQPRWWADPRGFVNVDLGTDGPPPASMLPTFPELAYDSFVTIGVDAYTGGVQPVQTVGTLPVSNPDMPDNGAWFTTDDTIGIAGNYPMNRVRVARITFRDDVTACFGVELNISYRDNNGVHLATMYWGPLSECPWPDCNENYYTDLAEIQLGLEEDCNGNSVPDFCDIRDGTSFDNNGNGIPDECEIDCLGDLNGDGFIGQEDLGILLSSYGVDDGGDLNGDGQTNQADLGILLSLYGTECPD